MARRGSKIIIRSAKCVLVNTKFDQIGDSVEFTMPAAGLLTPATFTRKTIVTSGSFRTEFEDGNDITLTKEIWPLREHTHPGKFTTYSLEENSEYYCVIPFNNIELHTQTFDLNASDCITLEVGTINFIYGTLYSVAETEYLATNVFAIDKQPAQLVANQSVQVIQCSSRPS